eukprot:CAMPEP_0197848014 /NCGR_PEP_ID=MMETSP1438-20131217/7779_1 /TAXON_ID=1461541 /ORGANISM="Pterosperma sp., Strain CCMP1384" /LENGTH=299 /DNA_ID=CAMNT_0043460129 /DNA_START=171 /DNA_END=1070 /DNA_ORIENTATION=+
MSQTSKAETYHASIALIGDSTIDNVVWTRSLDGCVAHQLKAQLDAKRNIPSSPSVLIHNLAADGFTSDDVLKGKRPAISFNTRENLGDPFPFTTISEGHKGVPIFKPLACLKRLDPKPDVCVVSIGGNDVREILGSPMITMDLPAAVDKFQVNYPLILKEITSTCKKVVIMLQYRPEFATDEVYYGVYRGIANAYGADEPSPTLVNGLMETVYAPVVDLARKLSLPIIDLPNTFDIHDSSMYISQIEPSAEGGELIAELIAHVIENHPWKHSVLYSKPPQSSTVNAVVNQEGINWRVTL